MKFIKYAVGLVIALSVIPLVVVTVNNLEASRLRVVEFEVVDDGPFTFSENTHNDIHSLAIVDDTEVSNLINTTVNGVELVGIEMYYNPEYTEYSFQDGNNAFTWEELNDTNTAVAVDYTPTVGDKWTMTFEVPSPTPPLVKLLVGFVPLLLIGGILLFMLNKRKFD